MISISQGLRQRYCTYQRKAATAVHRHSQSPPRSHLKCQSQIFKTTMHKIYLQYSPLNLYSKCVEIRTNYPSMQIIRAYFMLHFYQWYRVVSRASMRIKQGVGISEGQIIRAILYNSQIARPKCICKLSE